MSKFLIFSLIFHTSLVVFFKFKTLDKTIQKNKPISIAYIEEKPAKKKSAETQKKSSKQKEAKQKNKKNKQTTPPKKKVTKTQKKPEKNLSAKTKKKVLKKIPKDQKNRFDDMLKDLAEKELVEKKNTSNIENIIKNLSDQQLTNNEPSPNIKELQLIRKILMDQINSNWSRPPGIKAEENISIKLIINLNPNGYITDIKIPASTDKQIKQDKTLQPHLDSAIRAIRKSSPFEGLKKHSYNIWKKNTINFMPFETYQ